MNKEINTRSLLNLSLPRANATLNLLTQQVLDGKHQVKKIEREMKRYMEILSKIFCDSTIKKFTTVLLASAALLATTAVSATTVNLSWDSVTYAEKYKLMRDAGNGFEEVYIDSLPAFSDVDVVVGSTYTYKVIGCLVEPVSGTTLCEDVAEYSDEYPVTIDAETDGYYFLNSRWVGKSATVVGLLDNTNINVGGVSHNISIGETLSYSVQTQGEKVAGDKPFSIGTATNGLDMPVHSSFIGTQFVIPQIRYSHYYYLLSPKQNTTASITVGISTATVNLVAGQVYRYSAGSSRVDAGIIRADVPILVSHSSTTTNDPYPVPPVATKLWGVRTTNAYVGASQNNTSVQVWASNGAQQTITLNAGDYKEVTVGLETSEGRGSAIHLISDKPIGAIQLADSDGVETTAFLTQNSFATHYIIPVATQYVAMVCNTPNTVIALQDANGNEIDSAVCDSDGTAPGKAYFGSATDGNNIAAGAKIMASQPIYLIYETAVTSDEHNLLGYTPPKLIDIDYPGSGEGETTHTTAPFIATATPIQGNESAIQKVEFSLNGTDWFSALLVDGVYQYDFGTLDAGDYVLFTQVTLTNNEITTLSQGIEVVKAATERRVIFIHTDLLGSPAAETNEQGNVQ